VDHSAAYDAGRAAGAILGYAVIYGGILALGAFIGNRLARKRGTLFVRWPLHVAFALVLLLLASQCGQRSRSQATMVAIQA